MTGARRSSLFGSAQNVVVTIPALVRFGVGVYKARTMAGHPDKGELEMALIGTLSALVGYAVGALIKLPPTSSSIKETNMSRLAFLFLMILAPALAIFLALLGLETLGTNFLGWFLLVFGIAYPAGGVIYYFIRRDPF